MRTLAWAIIVLLGTVAGASADCGSDVSNAIQTLRTSGPFHFVSQQWNKNFMRQTAGRIDPGKAQHNTTNVQNGWPGDEVIFIGSQSWRNDGLGWQGPRHTFGGTQHTLVIPDEGLLRVTEKCTIANTEEGTQIKKYDFNPLASRELASHSFLISADLGAIVRYEKIDNSKNGISVISIYHHDPTIRIEPPIVDMGKRLANALAAFENAVALTDQECRSAVMKLLQLGRETRPFEYKIEGDLCGVVYGACTEYSFLRIQLTTL